MNTNTIEVEKSLENEKSGTQMGHTAQARLSKTSVDYWKKKVRPRVIRGVPSPELYVRFHEAGRDAWLPLDSSNRLDAAGKARDHWVRMKAIGLPALLAELSPDPRPTQVSTVAEAINAASELTTVRAGSFFGYAKRLRQIAGEIAKIRKPKNALSRNAPEALAWKASVGAIRLDVFTPAAVNKWKAERIAASRADPMKRRAATVTADSVIRLARAIFSRETLGAGLGKAVNLPDPLPFAGVSYGPSHRRFVTRVDPSQLFAAARADLEKSHPQQFLAFCLCLLAGLRRSEADALTWAQVDLENSVIRIQATEYFEPKSEDATREIELDAVAVDILRRAKSDNPDPVFVLKGGPFKPQIGAHKAYRANAAPHYTWEGLIAWLGTRGVKDSMPIHVLRKLAGSLVFQAHGIEQARGFLGHGDVSTTSRSYIAKTKRVVVSLSPLDDEVSKAREAGEGGTR